MNLTLRKFKYEINKHIQSRVLTAEIWKTNVKRKWNKILRSVYELLQYGCVRVIKGTGGVTTSEKHSRKKRSVNPSAVCYQHAS